MTPTTVRKSAEVRREEILAAAMEIFAEKGLHGASTDDIARTAGVSQPYLFRLYGTKKELFIASVSRCLEDTLALFRASAGGKLGEEALEAIGQAYTQRLVEHSSQLRLQLNAYAACDDPEICDVVRRGYGRLVEFAEHVSGASPERITRFFSFGMLLNVIASMGLLDADEPWARRMLEAYRAQIH